MQMLLFLWRGIAGEPLHECVIAVPDLLPVNCVPAPKRFFFAAFMLKYDLGAIGKAAAGKDGSFRQRLLRS